MLKFFIYNQVLYNQVLYNQVLAQVWDHLGAAAKTGEARSQRNGKVSPLNKNLNMMNTW